MKKIIILIIVLIILLIGLAVFAIINHPESIMKEKKLDNEVNNLQNDETINQNNSVETDEIVNNNTNDSTQTENTRVKLTINNEEMYIKLDDNKASKDFVEMLPLTVECEDYNNTEKIAYLAETVSTEGSPDGYTPKIGDFAYYVPWGNLSIFYKDFRYSNSLIKLGTFESGIEKITDLNGDFTATFELVNN